MPILGPDGRPRFITDEYGNQVDDNELDALRGDVTLEPGESDLTRQRSEIGTGAVGPGQGVQTDTYADAIAFGQDMKRRGAKELESFAGAFNQVVGAAMSGDQQVVIPSRSNAAWRDD